MVPGPGVLLQGEEAEGDPGGRAAAGQEHEQPARLAGPHRDRAVQTHGLRHLRLPGDPEEAGPPAGTAQSGLPSDSLLKVMSSVAGLGRKSGPIWQHWS